MISFVTLNVLKDCMEVHNKYVFKIVLSTLINIMEFVYLVALKSIFRNIINAHPIVIKTNIILENNVSIVLMAAKPV